jgi:hypothetical protein
MVKYIEINNASLRSWDFSNRSNWMFSLGEAGDRVAAVQMNAELRHAQLEMLSAQCATDRLRLRYSAEEIACHGQREILRKAWTAANSLFEYYSSIVKQMPEREMRSGSLSLSEARVLDASDRVAGYIREQQERFRPIGLSLKDEYRSAMMPFFSPELLAQVRLVRLDPQRAPNPPLLAEAKALGIANAADLTHMPSLTFEDVLVFQGELTDRTLFHALVHAVQFEVLGLKQYAELLVRGFVRTRSHASVPLEAHAFMLESGFAEGPAQPFSVEEKVRLWTNQGRYSQF